MSSPCRTQVTNPFPILLYVGAFFRPDGDRAITLCHTRAHAARIFADVARGKWPSNFQNIFMLLAHNSSLGYCWICFRNLSYRLEVSGISSSLVDPACFIALQTTLHISALVFIPSNHCELSAREYPNSPFHHATWQHSRENDRFVRGLVRADPKTYGLRPRLWLLILSTIM